MPRRNAGKVYTLGSTGILTLAHSGEPSRTLSSQIPPIALEYGILLDNLGKAETLADSFALASSNANLSRISHKSKILLP